MRGSTICSRMSILEWLIPRTKSILVDTKIVMSAATRDKNTTTDVHVQAIELNYGALIYFRVQTSIPFTKTEEWFAHPLMFSSNYMDGSPDTVANIVDDTPAIRAMIEELVSSNRIDVHKARLINAILSFWN